MVHGLSTCAHCGAILMNPVCSICGKSEQDEVEVVEADPRQQGLSAESKRQLRNVAGFIVAVALVAGVGYVLLNREAAEPTPTALATPTPTSSTTSPPAPTVDPPTIARPEAPVEPLPTIEVGAEREVETSDGANPWNGAPPRNVLSGLALDNTDYAPGIAAVADRLAAAPADFTIAAPNRTTWNDVDLAAAETAQPFAARSVDTGAGSADVWIIARGPSTTDGSAAFLRQAIETWPLDEPLGTHSPRPGIRLLQLTDDGSETTWIDVRDGWLLLYRAPSGIDAGLLGAISSTRR